MDEGKVIDGRYHIISQIGKGGFGIVYKVKDLKRNFDVAMKVDIKHNGSVLQEAKVLHDLQEGEGIPKLYCSGYSNNSAYMILQLLGENLSQLLRDCKSFSLNTISLILLQAISRIEHMHNKGYIHRDIKPQQFLLGPHRLLYLVDYGLAKKFMIEHCHILYQTDCSRAGSPYFASVNSHTGIRLSRRDDFESLVYMAIYMLRRRLPWSCEANNDQHNEWDKCLMVKRDIKDQELFHLCPQQFATMFHYVKGLKFEDKPDYEYLRGLITLIRQENDFKKHFLKFTSPEKHNTVKHNPGVCDSRKNSKGVIHGHKSSKKKKRTCKSKSVIIPKTKEIISE